MCLFLVGRISIWCHVARPVAKGERGSRCHDSWSPELRAVSRLFLHVPIFATDVQVIVFASVLLLLRVYVSMHKTTLQNTTPLS